MNKKQLTLDDLREYIKSYVGITRYDSFFEQYDYYQLFISSAEYQRLAPNGWCSEKEGFCLWSMDIPDGEMVLKEPGYGSQLKTIKSTLPDTVEEIDNRKKENNA